MKIFRTCFGPLILFAVMAIAGCGHSHSTQITTTTSILSNASIDGDIELTLTDTYIITQGMSPTIQSVFAGVDPVGGSEFRAFLNFPLGGAGGIPYDGIIDSASLDIYINTLQSNSDTVPIRIELVSFDQSTLFYTDFDRVIQPPLTYITINPPISIADVGSMISIDVTTLMDEAQAQGLRDFQVRILEDFNISISGIIEINDTTGTNRSSLAPLLTVSYH